MNEQQFIGPERFNDWLEPRLLQYRELIKTSFKGRLSAKEKSLQLSLEKELSPYVDIDQIHTDVVGAKDVPSQTGEPIVNAIEYASSVDALIMYYEISQVGQLGEDAAMYYREAIDYFNSIGVSPVEVLEQAGYDNVRFDV